MTPHEERLQRADEYMRQASFIRGMARTLLDLRDHIATMPTGSDPAREAVKVVRADLLLKHSKALAEAQRLEGLAERIRELMQPTQPKPTEIRHSEIRPFIQAHASFTTTKGDH